MRLEQQTRQDVRGNVLFIASANPEHVRVALRGLCATYPHETFDVIGRHEAINAIGEFDGCRVIHVTGTAQGRLDLVRRLRQTGYATVAFVEAGSGGFVALQILPLLLGIRTTVLVDEDGSIVPVGASTAALRHVGDRLKKQWKAVLYSTGRSLLRTILTPVGIAVLLVRTVVVMARRRPTPARLT